MARSTFVLAAGLLFAGAASGSESPADAAVDRESFLEDRIAAIEPLRGTQGLESVLAALGARAADPKEEVGERRACLRLCGTLGKDARSLLPSLLQVLSAEDATPGL